jgi:hypothetical protein
MAAQFPDIKPSSRSFQLGQYPTKVYRSLSGATVKRSFGNRPSGFQIKLVFNNVVDATSALILAHYTGTSGGFERFTLPLGLFAGMSDELRGYVQSPAGIKWEYQGPPEVQSVYKGLSQVTVNFTGELDF